MGETCHVCGKLLDEVYAVSCFGCGSKFHFESAEPPGDNCGSILRELDVFGLAFMCKQCLDEYLAQRRQALSIAHNILLAAFICSTFFFREVTCLRPFAPGQQLCAWRPG